VRQLGTVSTAEALEQDLERRILQGDPARGEHLREIELSEEYGVGRHTLRARASIVWFAAGCWSNSATAASPCAS
jgi:hypothetical protein